MMSCMFNIRQLLHDVNTLLFQFEEQLFQELITDKRQKIMRAFFSPRDACMAICLTDPRDHCLCIMCHSNSFLTLFCLLSDITLFAKYSSGRQTLHRGKVFSISLLDFFSARNEVIHSSTDFTEVWKPVVLFNTCKLRLSNSSKKKQQFCYV